MGDVPVPIDLPGVDVIKVEMNDCHELLITVETTEKSVKCRKCNRIITARHGDDKERRLRHLDVFHYRTYVIYKPHRYICHDCDTHPTTTATAIWHKPNSAFTIPFEADMLMELINSTITDVCAKHQLTEDCMLGIMDRHIHSEVNWDSIDHIGVLGIDEISLKKGYKDYVTLITSRYEGNIRLLGVINGREKAKIKVFLKNIPAHL